jgi:anti-sigma regulatory factor (Ser/Thr protein kinase)
VKLQTEEKIFSAKTEKLSEVLDFVENFLEKYQCPTKTKTSICVAIEEVFVNIARYAYEDSAGSVTLGIGFEEESRTVTFRIADKGVPFNPLNVKLPDITLSAQEREIGGLGIFITRKSMDSVEYVYENGENILTMRKKI